MIKFFTAFLLFTICNTSFADFGATAGSARSVSSKSSSLCSGWANNGAACTKDTRYPDGLGTCNPDTRQAGKVYYRCTSGQVYMDDALTGSYTCPEHSTSSGTGASTMCTCETGYNENRASSSKTSCEADSDFFSSWQSIVSGIVLAAAGVVTAALTCAPTAGTVCLYAAASAIAGAGMTVAGIAGSCAAPWCSTGPAPTSPTYMAVTQSPGSNSSSQGIHRDESGNLSPTGTGWTKTGDEHTKTANDGRYSSETKVNTKTDTATHKVTDSQTGKQTTTVLKGTGGSSGSSGSGGGSGGSSSKGMIIAVEEKNADGTSKTTVMQTNPSGQTTDVRVISCSSSGCIDITNNPSGGSTGGGSTGGGDTGGGSTGGGDTGGGSTGGGDTGGGDTGGGDGEGEEYDGSFGDAEVGRHLVSGEFSGDSWAASGDCPPPPEFTVLGKTLHWENAQFCQLLSYLKPMLIASSLILGVYIIIGFKKSDE